MVPRRTRKMYIRIESIRVSYECGSTGETFGGGNGAFNILLADPGFESHSDAAVAVYV